MSPAVQENELYYREEYAQEMTSAQWDRFEEAVRKFGAGPSANRKIAAFMDCGMHMNHVRKYRTLLKKRHKLQ